MQADIQTHDEFVRICGADVFTKTWAAGEEAASAPVVLFHDSLGCVDLWRGFPAKLALATGRRIIAYDRIGFGRSSPGAEVFKKDFVAAEATRIVPALCAALGITDFIACGHSVGGGMAVEAAAWMPEQCRAVVTISSQGFVEDKTLQGIRAAQKALQDEAQFAKLAKYHGAKTRWVLDSWVNTWLSPEFADWNLDAALSKVVCPMLVIHGNDDEYGSAAHPARLAGECGEVLTLSQTGHFPHREHEDMVVTAIQKFLADTE